jgi:hypothetical protein
MMDKDPPATPRPSRPVPVERAEAELLAGRAQAIAKGWLLTLLERAPLEAVAAIPAAELASEGPAVCAAFARALGADTELDRLRPAGDLAPLAQRIGALAGAGDAAATLAAVDALRACVWAAALDARGAREDDLAALAERLAEVALVAGATALAGAPTAAAAEPSADAASGADPAPPPSRAPVDVALPQAPAAPPADPAPPLAPAAPLAPAPLHAAAPSARDLRAPGGSVTELPARPPAQPDGIASAMDDGDLWIATLERHLDRCQREGGGLALLRVELVDGERLASGAGTLEPEAESEERGVPYGRLAQAIRRAIRRQDLVASDRQGRAWVIAPSVGRAGAIALAERIGAGVEHGEHWRGAPLAATIGFAVYGEDGQDAVTLIDRAEEAMLAASAAGVRIGESVPSGDGEGGSSGPRLVR